MKDTVIRELQSNQEAYYRQVNRRRWLRRHRDKMITSLVALFAAGFLILCLATPAQSEELRVQPTPPRCRARQVDCDICFVGESPVCCDDLPVCEPPCPSPCPSVVCPNPEVIVNPTPVIVLTGFEIEKCRWCSRLRSLGNGDTKVNCRGCTINFTETHSE
jgi:hypothetical protein